MFFWLLAPMIYFIYEELNYYSTLFLSCASVAFILTVLFQ